MKKGKAAGSATIGNEAWSFCSEEKRKKFDEVLGVVWGGEGFRKYEGLITPLHKEGEIVNIENYKGIPLLSTAYKIHAMVLMEKLKRKVEAKGFLSESPGGFQDVLQTIFTFYNM